MTVLPFSRTAGLPRVAGDPCEVVQPGGGPWLHSAARGDFLSPRGRAGLFLGSFRVAGIRPTAPLRAGTLCVSGVLCGVLLEADGTRLGWGTRSVRVTGELSAGSHVRVGPLDVDLLGLSVQVEPFLILLATQGDRQQPAGGPASPRPHGAASWS